MIRVIFTPPSGDPQWNQWIKDTAQATKELKLKFKNKEPLTYSGKLYKRMRRVIFEAFNEKCAYCEAKFILTETGDVDHYRPKGAITDEFGQRVMLLSRGKIIGPHPGYYWLAYDWRNLLPSCSKCNRPGTTAEGKSVGKWTRFPVLNNPTFKPGHARSPREIKEEKPVFIHPAYENPQAHFRFDPTTGRLIAKTKRGRMSIEILDLNRDGLSDERRDIYLSVESILVVAIQEAKDGNWESFLKRLRVINSYKDGKKPYSWVGRKALRDNRHLVKQLDMLTRSFPSR